MAGFDNVCFSTMIYIVFIFLLCFIIAENSRKYNFALCYSIIFLSLIIIQVQYQHLFSDYDNYISFFNKVEPINEIIIGNKYNFDNPEISFEFGFKIFTSITKFFQFDKELYLIFINIIVIIAYSIFIKRNVKHFFFVLISYYAIIYPSFQLGILRQAIASTLFIYSIHYISDRKIIYSLIVLIASSFHLTALILLFLPYFASKEKFIKYFFYIFCFGELFYLLKIDIVSYVFNIITNSFSGPLSNSIKYYLLSNYENNYLGIGFWDRSIQFILIFYIYLFLKKKEILNVTHIEYINISLFNILIQVYSFNYPIMTNRLRFYFCLFPFLLYETYLNHTKYKTNRIIMIIFCITYSFMMLNISTSYINN